MFNVKEQESQKCAQKGMFTWMFPRTRFVREKKIFNRETIQQKNTSVQWNTIQSVKNVVEIYAQQCENVPGSENKSGQDSPG